MEKIENKCSTSWLWHNLTQGHKNNWTNRETNAEIDLLGLETIFRILQRKDKTRRNGLKIVNYIVEIDQTNAFSHIQQLVFMFLSCSTTTTRNEKMWVSLSISMVITRSFVLTPLTKNGKIKISAWRGELIHQQRMSL